MSARRPVCWIRLAKLGALIGLLGFVSGCAFGPQVLEKSHGRYHESVKQVQDEEFLRNLVRLRYNESVSGLDISSITAQYELNGGAEARPFFLAPNPSNTLGFRSFTNILPDLTLGGANRPTIMFNPNDDAGSVRRLLTPVSPEVILFFSESGWPMSTILRLWVESANTLPNAEGTRVNGPMREALPDFQRFRRVADLLESLSKQGLTRFAVEVRPSPRGLPIPVEQLTTQAQVDATKEGLEFAAGEKPGTCVLVRKDRKLVLWFSPEVLADPRYLEICDLLWLRPDLGKFDVTQGGIPPYPPTQPAERLKQIDLIPRSAMQAMVYLSNGVSVPSEHFAEGIVHPTIGPDGQAFDWRLVTQDLFRVCSVRQHKRPEHAYVAIQSHGYWYYIDDRDTSSKSNFNLMLQLIRLDLGGDGSGRNSSGQARPLLSLPTGR